MSFKMKQPFIIAVITLLSILNLHSQEGLDLSSINYSAMTDTQMELLVRRASSMGYNQSDLMKAAKAQGLSSKELSTISRRFKTVGALRAAKRGNVPIEDTRLRTAYRDSVEVFREVESDIFGFNVFRGNSFLTFQSNLNIPTPADYILGPGDKLFIDIYGQSEGYYQPEISPEGTIILENFGPINVSGLSVTVATKRIKNRLSQVYQGLTGSQKNTFLNVSVGTPRAIRVNIVGEVELPGTYNFSAFNTVYNALYVAGGITEKATLRDIKVYRKNKLISKVDVYKYLTSGDATADVRLENNDLILVSPYTNRVSLNGEVKIEGRFELKENESLQDLIDYAGGFSENAYTKTIKVTRVVDGERMVADVSAEQFEIFIPKAGDVYQVDKVLDRYKNRVIVKGAVYRPGVYALSNGLGVKDLLAQTVGLKQDALTSMAYIVRTNNDLTTNTISFNLNDLLNGVVQDIPLQKEDVLTILSKSELKEDFYVEIAGAINQPGIYPFSEGMKLKDLILIAGGFKEAATESKIEITRRVSNSNGDDAKLAEVIVVDLEKNYTVANKNNDMMIYPFDHVTVRRNPNFHVQQFSFVEGQVYYPGKYAIQSKNEKISDLLKRSGGLNEFAYAEGATLIRRTEFYKHKTEAEQQRTALEALKKNLLKNNDSLSLSEAETALFARIEKDLKNLTNEISQEKKNAQQGKGNETEAIGIDLTEIINNPGGVSDLLVQSGDVLVIPQKQETVRLRGEVVHSTTVRYQKNKSLKHYINSAGGFENRAKRSGTYVIHPNGEIKKAKKILFFNIYPKVQPGSEIIVPKKPEKVPFRASSVLNVVSGLATLILAISQIK